MPFHGIPTTRRFLFDHVEPRADIGVSDAAAWRLNPRHRWVYDKLGLALAQGVTVAPAGVDPRDMGLAGDERVFVRPITNLAGMAVGAHVARVANVPAAAGTFWCRYLDGEQSSTDCLVRDGEVVWFAHTVAGDEWQGGRPVYWRIGVERPGNEGILSRWVAEHLPDYTGICNFELIGDTLIEAHLRGSTGFFDFYGPDFIPAWAHLVDTGVWIDPGPPPGGYLLSVFTERREAPGLDLQAARDLAEPEVTVALDVDGDGRPNNGRVAIVRSTDYVAGRRVWEQLRGMLAGL